MMQMEEKGIKRNYQEFKHSFDTIINAKVEEQRDEREREVRRGGTRTKQTARMSTGGAPPPGAPFFRGRMEVEEECEMMDE